MLHSNYEILFNIYFVETLVDCFLRIFSYTNTYLIKY